MSRRIRKKPKHLQDYAEDFEDVVEEEVEDRKPAAIKKEVEDRKPNAVKKECVAVKTEDYDEDRKPPARAPKLKKEEAQEDDGDAAYGGSDESDEYGEDEDSDDSGPSRKRNKRAAAAKGKGKPKGKPKGVPGQAYGQLRHYSMDLLPTPLLEMILDFLVDSHELRSYLFALRDMLAVRLTCKTLRDVAAAFMPAIERGLCNEEGLDLGNRRCYRPIKVTFQGTVYTGYTRELDHILRHGVLPLDQARLMVASMTGRTFLDQSHETTDQAVMRAMALIRKQLPPRFFGLSPRARQAVRNVKRSTLNKTESKSTYSLRDSDLELLPHTLRENPMDPRWAPMKLYKVVDLMKKCMERHGSVEGWRRFQDKNRVTAAKARATREMNQDSRQLDLREELESAGVTMTPGQIKYYFREYIDHKTGRPGPLAHRARQLLVCIQEMGGQLPKDSRLGKAYIDQDQDGKRRAAALAKKKASGKGASSKSAAEVAPAGPKSLAEIVPSMIEADFFLNKTNFKTIHLQESGLSGMCDGSFEGEYDYFLDDYEDDFFALSFWRRGDDDGDAEDPFRPYGRAWGRYSTNPITGHYREEMRYRDDLWEAAKQGSEEFRETLERALQEWMTANGIRTAAQLEANTVLPASLRPQALKPLA